MTTKSLIVYLTLFWLMPLPALSDVSVEETSLFGPTLQITITKRIEEKDAEAIERLDLSRTDVAVRLDSPGGDVRAAIRIGRLLRKYEASTSILEETGRCLSSCVLIYVAGVHRSGSGVLGLHRPYLAAAGPNPEVVRRATREMYDLVKKYLDDMGISPTVYDLMMRTEPEKMRTYQGVDEIAQLIPSVDPIWDEVATSYRARWHGVSAMEYRRRKAEAQSKCKGSVLNCWSAVHWGLSEGVYAEKSLLEKNCAISSDIWDLPFRLFREHPAVDAHFACLREIMYAR